jgi:hypothetical protein
VKPGSRITIWIHNVPVEAFRKYEWYANRRKTNILL